MHFLFIHPLCIFRITVSRFHHIFMAFISWPELRCYSVFSAFSTRTRGLRGGDKLRMIGFLKPVTTVGAAGGRCIGGIIECPGRKGSRSLNRAQVQIRLRKLRTYSISLWLWFAMIGCGGTTQKSIVINGRRSATSH